MAIQCFAVVRALRATAHQAAHRLREHHVHHVHHARHAVVKGAAHATKVPKVVCVAAGLATLGVGGFVAGGKALGPSAAAPNEIGSTANPPLSLGAESAGPLLTSLVASFPSDIAHSRGTPFFNDWLETGTL